MHMNGAVTREGGGGRHAAAECSLLRTHNFLRRGQEQSPIMYHRTVWSINESNPPEGQPRTLQAGINDGG